MSRLFISCPTRSGIGRAMLPSIVAMLSTACAGRPVILHPVRLSTTYHAFSIRYSTGCTPSRFEDSVGYDLPPAAFEIAASIYSMGLFDCVSSNPGGESGRPGYGVETGYVSAFGRTDFQVSPGSSGLLQAMMNNGFRAVLRLVVDVSVESNKSMELLIAPIVGAWTAGTERVNDPNESRAFYLDQIDVDQAIFAAWEPGQAEVRVDVTPIVERWATGRMPELGFLVAPRSSELTALSEGDKARIRARPSLLLVGP